ncbi:hypothetical protein AVEN_111869-1 [Araneus ventricosus]|uniref:Uncharacterized protein n=1 Tax=Araneus ventricosus TaxID=182803 RepID=A0A4Y2BYY8_ARAVE|nr:hypothetical protein AVEN_111869-1 [Araneus ventricosus]
MFSFTTSSMFEAGFALLVLVSYGKRCFRSLVLTYGSGFHFRMFGLLSFMNIRDETFEVDNLVLVIVTIMFMWLKPRTHSDELHGIRLEQFISGINSFATTELFSR